MAKKQRLRDSLDSTKPKPKKVNDEPQDELIEDIKEENSDLPWEEDEEEEDEDADKGRL